MSDFTAKVAYPSDTGLSPEAMRSLHLLEASAGTGKTYSIQTLYLRLVLVEGLTVQQILVVTFTRDATKELRERLQKILREALDYLDNLKPISDPDDRTRKIVDAAARTDEDKDTARRRLQLALLDFDMAAVFTIHGLCQRVLSQFAFETGQAFDVEPTGDSDEEIEKLCKDWWRKNVYTMDEEIAGFLSDAGSFTLEAITDLACTLIAKPDAKLDGVPVESGHEDIRVGVRQTLKRLAGATLDTNKFAGMPEDIRQAVKSMGDQSAGFKAYVCDGKWRDALASLQKIVEQEWVCPNPCKVAAERFSSVCGEFKDVASRASRDGFEFDTGMHLNHPGKPGLTAGYSERVYAAAETLLSQIEHSSALFPATPLFKRSGRTKAFKAAETIRGHVRDGNDSGITPSGLADTIKNDATGSLGLNDDVTITIDAVSPLFGQSLETLKSQPVLQAALAVKQEYQDSRSAAATASFNDFLVDLRSALKTSDDLRDVLREQFHAALIDEFQDTDPIQWGIFEKLFKDAGIPCFLVGDPKQAIYRFRNGDIETYQQAQEYVPDHGRHRLNKNFRSEKRLIDAVNQIFKDRDEAHRTFGSGIEYDEPLAAAGKEQKRSLLVSGEPDDTPFKIILINNLSETARLPGKSSPTAQTAYAVTAREIASILNDPALTIGDKRVAPGDIAVLVSKHEHAGYIAEQLSARGIPTVRQGTGDVWKSDEGHTLWAMLEAILDARNLSKVRNALISEWSGLGVEQIRMLNDDKSVTLPGHGDEKEALALGDWVARFEELRETWMKRGFPAMLRQLMATFDVKRRLLAAADRRGQRRLANIGHLAELVERKIIGDRKTPEGALSWVRRQLDREMADGGEEAKLRLETDDDAVRIMTIFASKGLEFPIVFAPTLFMMTPYQRNGICEYHDAQGALHIAWKSGNDKHDSTAKQAERDEMDRELVRQVYVALTRAVHRTVVIALKDRNAKRNEEPEYRIPGCLGDVLRLPMKKIEVKNNDDSSWRVVVDMDRVDERFGNINKVACAVDVRDGEPAVGHEGWARRDAICIMDAPPPRPTVDTSKGHGSFSSLAPREGEREDIESLPASSEDVARNRDGETAMMSGWDPTAKPEGMFAFPAGARTGTCWHEIFEALDFDAEEDEVRKAVEQKLGIHGFLKDEVTQKERIDETAAMVTRVLAVTLTDPGLASGGDPFALRSVGNKDRKTEWAFSFATLQGKRTSELREEISKYAPYRMFADAVGVWDKEIPGGYLTGFVDLLFRKHNRYFIVDWKSNRRNGTQKDFAHGGLMEEISLHRYWLQYLLYTVAVHQYLTRALPGYDYEKCFGGVYYIFLRGVDGEMTDGCPNGIYVDRPPRSLVNTLSTILGDFS